MVALTCLALVVLAPWWDDYPYTVAGSDPDLVRQVGANTAHSGAVDDPTWGIETARIRARWLLPRFEPLQAEGVRLLTWVETFGTTHSYVAAFRTGPDGRPLGHALEPGLPQPVLNHWSWQNWRPAADLTVRWLGLESYFDDDPLARPFTRTHPRYGSPLVTYPDGSVATGRLDPARPDTARVFDAAGAKNFLGKLDIEYQVNPRVAAAGVTEHLLAVPGPDGPRYSGLFLVGKDSAAPIWIDYARASARQLADFGIDGLWADNFSAWDSLGSRPLDRAFGDWSVAGWRPWVTAHGPDPGPEPLIAALRNRLRALGGNDNDLRDPHWCDDTWLDDPIWRSFLCYKQAVGREALQRFHDAFHEAARAAGRTAFGIQGNDIPFFSFGMPQPSSLEMVSSEVGPGWNLFCGPRGIGLPPAGRLAPVVRLARAHAHSRFVQFWYYLDGPYADRQGDDPLFLKLAWEALANHATLRCDPGTPKVAGSVTAHATVARFVGQLRSVWGDRQPWARIGLVYSADSQLAQLTPGGLVPFDAQTHPFDLLGWGTWLAERQLPYTVLPADALTPAALTDYRVLLWPSVTCLNPAVLETVVHPWLENGGTLILSGPTGLRGDRSRWLARLSHPADGAIARLAGLAPDAALPPILDRPVGRGRLILCPARGFDYYQTAPDDRDLATLDDTLPWFAPGQFLASPPPGSPPTTTPGVPQAGGLPAIVEAVPYVSVAGDRWYIDLANLGDAPAEAMTLHLAEPAHATTATLYRPGREPVSLPLAHTPTGPTLGPFGIDGYGSVVLSTGR